MQVFCRCLGMSYLSSSDDSQDLVEQLMKHRHAIATICLGDLYEDMANIEMMQEM